MYVRGMEWNILIIVYLSLFIASPLIVILHELGHAFAYLALTKPSKIDIYIGSYGDKERSTKFTIGKLNFYIKKSFPFVKGIGLCVSSKCEVNYQKYIIILLAGSIFTLLTAALATLILINANTNIFIQIGCYIFLGRSAISLLINLTPYKFKSIYSVLNKDSIYMESDGRQLLFALKVKNDLPVYMQAQTDIQEKNYQAAADKLKQVLVKTPGIERISRQLTGLYLHLKLYADAEVYASQLITKKEPEVNDILNVGCLQSLTGKHDEAIETYQKVLKRDHKNLVALNNLGEEMIRKGAHKVAQHLLDRAIAINPNFEHPYLNLGYSKLLQGELAEGKSLIDKSISLNDKNASAYIFLAIYYSKMGHQDYADKSILKARELDPAIDTSDYDQAIKTLPLQQLT